LLRGFIGAFKQTATPFSETVRRLFSRGSRIPPAGFVRKVAKIAVFGTLKAFSPDGAQQTAARYRPPPPVSWDQKWAVTQA
jgi:hypothetical protein